MIVKGGFVHVAFALIKRITIVRRSRLLVFSDIMASIECMLYNVSFLNSFCDVLRNRTDFID